VRKTRVFLADWCTCLTGTREHAILILRMVLYAMCLVSQRSKCGWRDGKTRRSKADGGDFRVGAAALE
jgi:hypothetical protein